MTSNGVTWFCVIKRCLRRFKRRNIFVPHRLAELLSAIVGEPDPAVRGRAAALLLRDLASASARAQVVLDEAVAELQQTGEAPERIAALLELPPVS
jgi:hypothetical protein